MIIRLLKAWKHAGGEYKAGECLRIPDAICANLIEEGIGKDVSDLYDDEADLKPEKVAKAVAVPDKDDEVAALKKTVEALTEKIGKMAETPKGPVKTLPDVKVVKEGWMEDPTVGYGKGNVGLFMLDVAHAVDSTLGGGSTKHFRRSQQFLRESLSKAYSPNISMPGLTSKAQGSDEVWTGEMSRGGALMPIDFRTDLITQEVMPSIARSNGARIVPVNGTSVIFPITKDFDRSAGLISNVSASRDGERDTATASQIEFAQFQLTPQRLSGAGHLTGYALSQNPALGEIVLGEMFKAVQQKENREHIKGDGGGESTGVLNQDGAFSSTRVGSGLDPIDIRLMYSRNFNPSNAVWLAGWDSFNAIIGMSQVIGVGGSLVIQHGGHDVAPVMTILGRPVIFNEFMPAADALGDLMFVDFSQYWIADSAYRKADRTMFVRYLADQETFRLIQYTIANSHWPSTIKNDSGFEKSPFVKLAAA